MARVGLFKARRSYPLLQQLEPGGIMVIPVGPPGAQHILEAVKTKGADGELTLARSDIFGGQVVPFAPLTRGHPTESG